ncbi:hypothetical protein GOM49_04155 [Clostridium bovifaecis]|uniref:CARD domain-containing protein n=1 Tax=Clostridium bovifaecis TaxID=2184719 RepID=A0A6I6EZH8_9CLOT|nr:hypothetical protein GOM49_04155 [Clostridium bovifaecis]
MKDNKKKSALKSIIIGATILSIGASVVVEPIYVLAKESSRLSISSSTCRRGKEGNILKDSLKELVKEGTLTQEKADNVLSYIKKNKDKGEGNIGLFDEMVKGGVITNKEADAIRDKKADKKILLRKEMITKSLAGLVKDKTITQEQANKFIEKLEKQNEERRELHKKLRSMSQEERKDYIQKNGLRGKDIIKEMVKEGIITQEQAEVMRDKMPKPKPHKEKVRVTKEESNN